MPVPLQLPKVAIVGRPNVGKSTLLNRLCGSRVAIVEPTAGVTRDRISVAARLHGPFGERWIEVIDTGGVGVVDRDDLGPHVEEQIRAALGVAELILLVVDVRDGVTPLDREVAKRLRGTEVPVLLVVNKAEGKRLEWDVDVFRGLGVGDGPFAISAQNGEGIHDLSEAVLDRLPGAPEEPPGSNPSMRMAVVGRRNSGKSTLINRLAREERMIVSEIPGTTRDSVDVVFERDGERFVAIDTAGVRKKTKHEDAIEFFSEARSHRAVRRADVVVLLIDVTRRVSALEKTLAKYATDHYKPVVLAANKWDLVDQGRSPEEFREYLDAHLPGLAHAPIAFLSALDGGNVEETLGLCRELFDQARQRVDTSELNRVLERALEARSPNSKGYRVRIKYATQAEVAPPTFVLFVNDKQLIGKDYLRYLTNCLRNDLPFPEVPLRIVLRDKHQVPEGDRTR
jgi:GTP-binding protein